MACEDCGADDVTKWNRITKWGCDKKLERRRNLQILRNSRGRPI